MILRALYSGIAVAAAVMCGVQVNAQSESDFRTKQFQSDRVVKAWEKYEKPLRNLFNLKNLQWPAQDIYIRAFKLQNELEIWARDNSSDSYKHVNTYGICALSGKLGPKRQRGDKQVPEGYYFIEEFNAYSEYHLSLGISYPNYSDLINTHGSQPGGNIYIHGGCLTVGCIPMGDEVIKEIYTICLNARLNGQNYIPIHIYPTRLSENGIAFLQKEKSGSNMMPFWRTLKAGYDYFEQNHKLLPVMYSTTGNYIN
jgi:murein L,D-transpeptidase YafK